MAAASTTLSSSILRTPSARATTLRTLPGSVGRTLFGFKAGRGRVTASATYNVKLITPEGPIEFECPDDEYILDVADEKGISMPYSCRAGSCSSCLGMVVEGKVDQSDGNFLDPEQMDAGFVLTCVAYALSDVVIETHKEEEIIA